MDIVSNKNWLGDTKVRHFMRFDTLNDSPRDSPDYVKKLDLRSKASFRFHIRINNFTSSANINS